MHIHGPGCGHPAVVHHGHLDFLVDGRLENGDEIHTLNGISQCAPGEPHQHGEDCLQINHGDHSDCIVDGRLLHRHGDHDDDHGQLIIAEL